MNQLPSLPQVSPLQASDSRACPWCGAVQVTPFDPHISIMLDHLTIATEALQAARRLVEMVVTS